MSNILKYIVCSILFIRDPHVLCPPCPTVSTSDSQLQVLCQPSCSRADSNASASGVIPDGTQSAAGILTQISPRPRTQTARKRIKHCEKATELTSSPYKTELQQKAKAKTAVISKKKQKHTFKKSAGKNVKTPYKTQLDKDPSSEEEPYENLCVDSDGDSIEMEVEKPRKRMIEQVRTADNCLVCGEFGKDNELWYRCRICGFWAHCDCTGADKPTSFVCDYCSPQSPQFKKTARQ